MQQTSRVMSCLACHVMPRARDEIPKVETRNEIDEIRNTKLQAGTTNLQGVVSNFNDIP
jgi:hypothetical protein